MSSLNTYLFGFGGKLTQIFGMEWGEVAPKLIFDSKMVNFGVIMTSSARMTLKVVKVPQMPIFGTKTC